MWPTKMQISLHIPKAWLIDIFIMLCLESIVTIIQHCNLPNKCYYRNLMCFYRWQLYISSKFSVSQCNCSLINHWLRASFPLIYRGLQCHLSHVCWKETFRNALIVDQSLAAGFIPINIWQQRASLPFKPSCDVLERKVYNNDDITF